MKTLLGLAILVLLVSGCVETGQSEPYSVLTDEEPQEIANEVPEPEAETDEGEANEELEPTSDPEPETEESETNEIPAGELTEFILKKENGDPAAGILALKAYGDKLYAADGDGRIFEFGGSEWEQIHKVGGIVHDLEVFGGKLYLGTRNGNIFSFNGSGWEPVSTEGSSLESTVLDLHSYGDSMYAGCASPSSSSTNDIHIYSNSQWSSFSQPELIENISAFADYGEGGPLYVASGEKIYTFQDNSEPDGFPELTDSTRLSGSEKDEYHMITLEGYSGHLFIGTGDNCRIYFYNGQNSVPIDDLNCARVWDLMEYNGKLYAVTEPSKLYASTTGYSGMWGLVANLSTSSQALALERYDGKLYIGANESRVYEYNCPGGECAAIEDTVYISPQGGGSGGYSTGGSGGTGGTGGSEIDEGDCNETALGLNDTVIYTSGLSFRIMMIDFPADLQGKAMALLAVNNENNVEALTVNIPKTINGIRVTATRFEKRSDEEYKVTLKMCK